MKACMENGVLTITVPKKDMNKTSRLIHVGWRWNSCRITLHEWSSQGTNKCVRENKETLLNKRHVIVRVHGLWANNLIKKRLLSNLILIFCLI
jgi:hypothetical protein